MSNESKIFMEFGWGEVKIILPKQDTKKHWETAKKIMEVYFNVSEEKTQ